MKKYLPIFFLATACAMCGLASAQSTQLPQDPDTEFKTAKELYQKEQFSLAYPVFKKIYSIGMERSNMPMTLQLESKYYYILCGLKLNDATAEPLAVAFTELEHDVPHVQMMSFHLGEYYYRNKSLGNALAFYQKSSIANLSNREIADMKFHQAYAHFTLLQFDLAKPLFNAIRQIPKDPNYTDANYYYGFIAFNEKSYNQAIESFLIAEKSPDYQNIVPFYLTEIYYFNGAKDQALAYGEKALAKGGQYYELQLQQLVGHLYFEKKQYARALPFLEKYVASKDKVRREDLYELAYCYYEARNWLRAIEGFKQLGGAEDSLAQNSMYLLADAYLKTNDKPNARNAFLFGASNNSNAIQKEISLFNYAKLSYELGYMDAALKSFQDFIARYPAALSLQEAKELLVSTLANTSGYKEGLALYESLAVKSENVMKIYPRLLYGRSVELVNDQEIEEADLLLTRLLQVPYNTSQMPLAYFWKGEIAYRTGGTEAAIGFMTNYLKNPLINGEVNTGNARYILAYSQMKNENYQAARENFELIAKGISNTSSAVEQDAFVRAADCYFMVKDFRKALGMYEQVMAQQWNAADYALYQKAIIAGASNKNSDKISLLQSLEQKYPLSGLIADANLEIANTYLSDENYKAAVAPLNKVIRNAKAISLRPEAYLKLGVVFFNLDQNKDALESFKLLMSNYPNAPESNDAIEYVRNIFIENQQPGEFVTFMRNNGKPVTFQEADSLSFRSPMLRYEVKDLAGAKSGFAEYLSRYPDGRYAVEANFYSAEIFYAAKQFSQALPFYTAVAGKALNRYAERSVLQAARIYYFELKDYVNAEKYFIQLKTLATQQENKLEAMRGLLRCQFKTQQWKEAAPNAAELLLENGIASDDRMMASMVLAKNHQINNELELAAAAYRKVMAAGKSEYGAESQYRIAEILYLQDQLTAAEKAAFEVIKKSGSYEFWVTKSYVLLGDIYFKQKDWFNAEATFKSVVDNGTIPALKTEAQEKLNKVIGEKNKANKVEQL